MATSSDKKQNSKAFFLMIDIRQTAEYAKYLQKIGWIVERKDNVNYFVKKMPIIKGVLKVQRPEKIDIDLINKIAQKYGVFQIIIEPKSKEEVNLLPSSFKLSKSPYLPSKTLFLDLTKSKEKLLAQMKKDARRAIKRGEGKKMKEIKTKKELQEFRNAWKKTVGFKRFVPPFDQLLALRQAFQQDPPLFLASHNDNAEIIGGAIFTRSSENFSYYWQAFSNKEARASLSQYVLVWKGILWAKRNRCKIFDFEGIYDSRFPNKSWAGFTHFKRSFGGYEATYPGAFVKTRLPI